MKKVFAVLLASLLLLLTACTSGDKYYIGVSFFPMDEVVELIEEDLKDAGFNVKIIYYSNDYVTPNVQLKDKEIDINLIQHFYFMEEFNEAQNANLVLAQPIYHATFALYSPEYTNVLEIPTDEKVTITLPNDATNLRRAINLLYLAELIDLPEDKVGNATLDDILPTSRVNFNFDLVPLNTLSQRYLETGLAIMYPTYALDLNLEGDEQRLFVEPQTDFTNGFAISAVAREDNIDSEFIQKFIELVTQDKVRDLLVEKYSWA